MKHKVLYSLWFVLLVLFGTCTAFVHDIARSLKVVHVKSLRQQVVDERTLIFEGSVEVLVDHRLHIWADKIVIDKDEHSLCAYADEHGSVLIEDNNFTILSQSFECNLKKKTGHAQDIRLHVDEGYLSAQKAEKINDTDWSMEHVMYTACDAHDSHWSITARRAVVHDSYFVTISKLLFNVGGMPICAMPRFVLPIQGHSKSGFLIPRFFIDYAYGFGVKQEYYKYLSPHADTTLGVDWRYKKGIMFFNEFRWALAPESYMQVNSSYAVTRDRFVQKGDRIVKATDRHYNVSGTDFRTFKSWVSGADLYTLAHLDFGNDKRIGYHFFNSTDGVDDTFFNSINARLYWPNDAVSVHCGTQKVSRKYFTKATSDQAATAATFAQQKNITNPFVVRELEDRQHQSYVPQIAWSTGFKDCASFVRYRHDLFFDHVWSRQEEIERLFVSAAQVQQGDPIAYHKADIVRLNYQSQFSKSFTCAHNRLSVSVSPQVSCASRRFLDRKRFQQAPCPKRNVLEVQGPGMGACDLFCSYAAHWALPEGVITSQDGRCMYWIAPLLSWDATPKFFQEHWAYFDRLDRAYPQNQLAAVVRNGWSFDDFSLDVDVTQAYDFYPQKDIFMMRRGDGKSHFLPLRCDFSFGCNDWRCDLRQEYGLAKGDLLQSELSTSVDVGRVRLGISYLFQTRTCMEQRKLLTNIPHFIASRINFPLSSHASITYEGQFYAMQRSSMFFFDGIKPLIHRIGLDYDGHCWGCYVGFEEKKYKECGIGRNERAFVFSFRLDSLGSFAKKFKSSPLLKHQQLVP